MFLLRLWQGPKAMVAAGIIGGGLGLFEGLIQKGGLWIQGFTYQTWMIKVRLKNSRLCVNYVQLFVSPFSEDKIWRKNTNFMVKNGRKSRKI